MGFSDLLHLSEDHGRNLLGMELLLLTLELDADNWLAFMTRFYFEWPKLDVFLDLRISEFSSNESLGVKDGVLGISGDLGLGSISDETLIFSEGYVRGGGV